MAVMITSGAAHAQTHLTNWTAPSVVCKFSYVMLADLVDAGKPLTDEEQEWAVDIEDESDLERCSKPPLRAMLMGLAVIGDNDNTEDRANAAKFNKYLKLSVAPEKYMSMVSGFMNGEYGNKVPKTAVYWLEYAADIGDPQALYELSGVYELGAFHITKDPATAVVMERSAADKGSAIAMFAQGVRYLDGNQVSQSTKTGMKWLKKAAEYGYADAVYFLATAYNGSAEGKSYGIKKDLKRSKQYMKTSAEAGNTTAMGLYASLLLRDPKSMQYEDEVFYWLNKAADAGNDKVQQVLAQVGPRLRENYRKSRERKAELRRPIFEQCPMVERCTVYVNQYGPTGDRYCAMQTDYANCNKGR